MQHECLYGSLLMPGYLSEIASKISSSRANVALRHGSALQSLFQHEADIQDFIYQLSHSDRVTTTFDKLGDFEEFTAAFLRIGQFSSLVWLLVVSLWKSKVFGSGIGSRFAAFVVPFESTIERQREPCRRCLASGTVFNSRFLCVARTCIHIN